MRWLTSLCALLIATAVGGCAIIEAEKDNRGGFLDKAADDLWMKADSKKMRALRALAIEASLARIAMISPKSAPDRTLLARRIGETTKRADVVRKCAFVQPLIAGQAANEPCFFFDSVMVDYENALFDLALVALPIDDARNLLTRVTGGVASVAINPLELVQTLLDIGREAFRVGRVVGAIYRDTLELEVQVWLASPGIEDLVAGLRSEYDRGNDDILAWRGHIAALRALGLEPVPDQRFIKQIYILLEYICGQIVSKTDPAYDDCRQPNIMQSVPTVVGAARPLFGPAVIRGDQSGQQQRPAQTAQQQAAAKQAAALASQIQKDYKRIILNYRENVHLKSAIQPVLRRLCVADADLDSITGNTVTLVKVYQQAAKRSVTGLLTEEEIRLLLDMPGCKPDVNVALNFYEAFEVKGGINSDDNVDLYNNMLPNGGKLRKPSTVAQVRTKLPDIRREVERRLQAKLNRRLQITDPFVSNQLTLDLYNALFEVPSP
jgi:hypothetical protein